MLLMLADGKANASGLVNCRIFCCSSSYSTSCSLLMWLSDVVVFFSAKWTRPVHEYGALLQYINETPPLTINQEATTTYPIFSSMTLVRSGAKRLMQQASKDM